MDAWTRRSAATRYEEARDLLTCKSAPWRKLVRPPCAFSISCVTLQALVCDIGRHSSISTRSPSLHSFVLVVGVVLLRARDDLAEAGASPGARPAPSRSCPSCRSPPGRSGCGRWPVAACVAGCVHLPRLLASAWCARARCRGAPSSIWLVLVSCCVAICMRRPNCALSSSLSSLFSSSPFLARSSLGFHALPQHPVHERWS